MPAGEEGNRDTRMCAVQGKPQHVLRLGCPVHSESFYSSVPLAPSLFVGGTHMGPGIVQGPGLPRPSRASCFGAKLLGGQACGGPLSGGPSHAQPGAGLSVGLRTPCPGPASVRVSFRGLTITRSFSPPLAPVSSTLLPPHTFCPVKTAYHPSLCLFWFYTLAPHGNE